MNSFVAHQWQDLLKTDIEFLDNPPPKNILHAIISTCDYPSGGQPVGLLPAIGYTNLVNIDKIVQNKGLQNGIESGRE